MCVCGGGVYLQGVHGRILLYIKFIIAGAFSGKIGRGEIEMAWKVVPTKNVLTSYMVWGGRYGSV